MQNQEILTVSLSRIAISSFQGGQDDFALKALQLETDQKVKASTLINIAKKQIIRQQESKAILFLEQALLAAKAIPLTKTKIVSQGYPDFTETRASLLEDIAIIYAQIGQHKKALQTAMVQDASEINRIKQRINCY